MENNEYAPDLEHRERELHLEEQKQTSWKMENGHLVPDDDWDDFGNIEDEEL